MSKASCVSRLLYEDTRSLRSRLLYGHCCGVEAIVVIVDTMTMETVIVAVEIVVVVEE